MVTAVVFSLTLIEAVAPPPLEVMTGASLTLVTVTVMVWSSNDAPSEALHGDDIGVVAGGVAGIGRVLEIGRRDEGQRTRTGAAGHDAELGGVVAGDDRIGDRRTGRLSGSVAWTVVTAVWFSATDMAAVAPPPSESMAGGGVR